MEIWIVMNTEDEVGQDSVLKLFESEQDAKLFIADYVLENQVNSEYLELFQEHVVEA